MRYGTAYRVPPSGQSFQPRPLTGASSSTSPAPTHAVKLAGTRVIDQARLDHRGGAFAPADTINNEVGRRVAGHLIEIERRHRPVEVDILSLLEGVERWINTRGADVDALSRRVEPSNRAGERLPGDRPLAEGRRRI